MHSYKKRGRQKVLGLVFGNLVENKLIRITSHIYLCNIENFMNERAGCILGWEFTLTRFTFSHVANIDDLHVDLSHTRHLTNVPVSLPVRAAQAVCIYCDTSVFATNRSFTFALRRFQC